MTLEHEQQTVGQGNCDDSDASRSPLSCGHGDGQLGPVLGEFVFG